MSKFLNILAILPVLSFIITPIYTLLAKEKVYINYHWFIVAVVSLQASSARLKQVHPVSTMVFISSILANLLLLIASAIDLTITPATFALFIGYLSVGFLIVMGNLTVNWYKQTSSNKCLSRYTKISN